MEECPTLGAPLVFCGGVGDQEAGCPRSLAFGDLGFKNLAAALLSSLPCRPIQQKPKATPRASSSDRSRSTDADQIQAIFPQWEIVRFLRDIVPWPYPPGAALEYLRDVALPEMNRGESFNWTLRLAIDPIASIGFLHLKIGESHNRGFWLGPPPSGQGLMTEACAWANDFWFDVLGHQPFASAKAVANTASRRISLKHGMRVIGTKWPTTSPAASLQKFGNSPPPNGARTRKGFNWDEVRVPVAQVSNPRLGILVRPDTSG